MALLHMETERVHDSAQEMKRVADEISEAASNLQRSLNRLHASWSGSSASRFENDLNYTLRTLRNASDNGMHLSRRVHSEVQEWERIDNDGAARISADSSFHLRFADRLDSIGDYTWIFEGGLGFIGLGGLRFIEGSTYANQVIIEGSQRAKDLAGVSSHLTHVKTGNLPGHIAAGAGKLTPIDLIGPGLRTGAQWIRDVDEYSDDPLRMVSAMQIDAAAIVVPTIAGAAVGGAVGAKVGGVVGGAIGAAFGGIGAVPGAAAGAVIGGIVGKIAGSWIADEAAVKPFMKSDFRKDLIDHETNRKRRNLDKLKIAADNIFVRPRPGPDFSFSW